MDQDEAELRATIKKIEATDARRANQIEYRDRQIRDMLAKGRTWKQLQEITGLSPRGLQLAIKRVS